ncbi:helix-turn-helix transcriptional regulator [Catenulispora yoronensis]|uniref:Helix-turn-helix transcriptional regulator n=1 Tax=Catenulispora yoronensis TaxID=450799 RepID=A0ABN2UCZ5_9ACTN
MGSGADGFAELLGSLKERSGLSYGVLAKRLHVGTSTLHRYVRGESVPAEYATIEKFARLTGATAAEMAELYRLWMLASEARSSTVAEVAAGEESGPEPKPKPVETSPIGEVLQNPPESSGVGPTVRTPRRLLPALAIVAVLGVGAGVAGVVFATSGKSSPQQSPGAAGPASSTSAASTSAAPISTAPTSLLPSSPSPSLPAPLSVDIRPYQWEDKCDQWYLLNRKPSEVPPPPPEQDARGWAKALGAVPAGTMKLELAVQGTSGDTVVLHSLHVRTMSKAAALPWSAFSMASGCGSGMAATSFAVDLDADRPLVRPQAGKEGDTVIPAVDFPFKVSKTDPQVLTVYAHATAVNVSWYLELDWSSGDRSGIVRIDDHGQPFQTSGGKGRPLYDYNMETGNWDSDETATLD